MPTNLPENYGSPVRDVNKFSLWEYVKFNTQLGVLISMITIIPYCNALHSEKRRMFIETTRIADTNKDYDVDFSEWIKVYRELGLDFDEYSSKPEKDLSYDLLSEYLSRHRVSESPSQN